MLFTEARWVALPATHPLAGREHVSFRDLWDEPFVAAPAETGWWRDWWLATGEREGHPVRIGAVTETGQPDDWLTAIANGYGVALAPESAARYYARPGVVYRPVTGVSPSQVGVAWPPAADSNPVVQDFVRCCRVSNERYCGARRRSLFWNCLPIAGRLFIRSVHRMLERGWAFVRRAGTFILASMIICLGFALLPPVPMLRGNTTISV